MQLSIEEHELVGFFESDHISREYGEDWFDSDSLYQFTNDVGTVINFAIHPIHKDIRISIDNNSHRILDWSFMGIQNMELKEKDNLSYLELVIRDNDVITLWIHPTIRLNRAKESENFNFTPNGA